MKNLLFNVSNYLLAIDRDTTEIINDGGGGSYTTTGNTTTLSEAAKKFREIVKSVIGPVMMVIGVLAAIYAIYLGVMYAKADSAEKRKEVQGRLIGACIGALIILVGATLCFALNWAKIWDSFSPTNR